MHMLVSMYYCIYMFSYGPYGPEIKHYYYYYYYKFLTWLNQTPKLPPSLGQGHCQCQCEHSSTTTTVEGQLFVDQLEVMAESMAMI